MTGGVMASETGPANRWRIAIWGGAALLLLAPLIAMQFTGEVRWSPGDFALLGAMLAVACGGYELAARASGKRAYRAAAALALLAGFALVWVNLAVGIIGSEDNPANLMFGGVLAVAAIGTALARGAARSMSRVMAATAAAQVIVALIAGSAPVWVATAVFTTPWLVSAWLFRRSAA